jgi:hypothetical protein
MPHFMVDRVLTTFVRSRATPPRYNGEMDSLSINGREALSAARELMDRYGEEAISEAGTRAARSRSDGNVVRFCHWRHVGRVIATLSSTEVVGSIH